MRKVDRLGRIVIPQELRKKYGMVEGADIEFVDIGEGVAVKITEPYCKICRARIDENSPLPLCNSCIENVVREYNEKSER